MRLAAEAASVPGARRFVCDGLADWGRAVVEDAALCVTEMAANAALHSGSRFMEVVVNEPQEGVVRVAVEDEGQMVPVEAVRPRAGRMLDDGFAPGLVAEDQPTTGRGLAIVSMLAESWGVDETAEGRRVWADLADTDPGPGTEHAIRPPVLARVDHAGEATSLPAQWKTVRLPGCPVGLVLRIDEHLDDLVRELQLIDADEESSPPRELGRLIERLISGPAWARHTGRQIALNAAAEGKDLVELEMTVPRALSPGVRELLELGDEADVLCEEYGLLTLAATPDMCALRTWFTESVCAQLEHDAEPVTYAAWLAARR